jgi:hypothetical protein
MNWDFLKNPTLYQSLPKLSPAVDGVIFLENNAGLMLDYVYEHVTEQQLTDDIELGIENIILREGERERGEKREKREKREEREEREREREREERERERERER